MNRLEYFLTTPEHTIGSALYIANAYLHGDIEAKTAIQAIQKNKLPRAKLIIADIASEEMWSSSPYLISTLLQGVESKYHSAKTAANNYSTPDKETIIRSDMRLAQLPLLSVLLGKKRLPGAKTTRETYEQLVAKGMAHVYDFHDIQVNSARTSILETKGALGELAVLLLAQRYAITSIGSDTWLPIQSKFSEDHGGDCISVSEEPAWDMTIYTHLKPDPIEVGSRVQIKTSNKESPDGVSVVHIYPDLALKHDYFDTTTKIISECYTELEKPESAERITKDLDKRTNSLLDRIDETAPTVSH